MRVHLVGISGTGMSSLAMLFREAGHDVQGSDVAFDPPVGPALRDAKIRCFSGYDAAHLNFGGASPDLVVVGNAIRKENPEAVAAEERELARASMSRALRDHFLAGRRPLVVCGTHGKTTTSAMCAVLLEGARREPGYFIGGFPRNFPSGAAIGSAKRHLAGPKSPTGAKSPFVVEGDEYDAVYWDKKPKFLDYLGLSVDDVAILTSVEHDHVDIYGSMPLYEEAFARAVRAVPEGGLIVCDAAARTAVALARRNARARVTFYGVEGDGESDVTPDWLAAPVAIDQEGRQPFDLFAGGVSCGRFVLATSGRHNVRNAVAALAACAEGFGVPVSDLRTHLATFGGVRRRQELLGEPNGIRVYDDFAHHPTAVRETLRALRAKHPKGALFAVFEPRSATACRKLHQVDYVTAFDPADHVVFAPLGRAQIPPGERLDLERLASEIGARAQALPDFGAILQYLRASARPGDTIALLSNGAMGGLHQQLLEALTS